MSTRAGPAVVTPRFLHWREAIDARPMAPSLSADRPGLAS